jgi:hypothetical protein
MDPFDAEFKKHIADVKKESVNAEQKIELTCSFIPGTTLRINKVKIPSIGFKVYDTPGILDEGQHYALIEELNNLKAFGFTKSAKPMAVRLKGKHTLWVGGIMRIDVLSVGLKGQTSRIHMLHSGQVQFVYDANEQSKRVLLEKLRNYIKSDILD